MKAIVTSDWHLLHNKVSSYEILSRLEHSFNTAIVKYKPDTIVIAGDIYDRLGIANSKIYIDTQMILKSMIEYFIDQGIYVYVLEGTPSHDNKQFKLIDKLIKEKYGDIDGYRYIEDIEIILDKRFNKYLLFIPDEIRPTAQDTFNDVYQLMKELDIDSVYATYIHGAFEHHMIKKGLPKTHQLSQYEAITDTFISCGHIHTYSHYRSCITQGSFDRLRHGEEELKGFIFIDYDRKIHKFLPNTDATTFITIKITNNRLDSIWPNIKNRLDSLKQGSHVLFKINSDIDKNLLVNLLRDYNALNIKIENNSAKTITEVEETVSLKYRELIPLNRDNIVAITKQELENKKIKNVDELLDILKECL